MNKIEFEISLGNLYKDLCSINEIEGFNIDYTSLNFYLRCVAGEITENGNNRNISKEYILKLFNESMERRKNSMVARKERDIDDERFVIEHKIAISQCFKMVDGIIDRKEILTSFGKLVNAISKNKNNEQ